MVVVQEYSDGTEDQLHLTGSSIDQNMINSSRIGKSEDVPLETVDPRIPPLVGLAVSSVHFGHS